MNEKHTEGHTYSLVILMSSHEVLMSVSFTLDEALIQDLSVIYMQCT